MNPIKSITLLYHRIFSSPTKYARYLGVTIGSNNLIGKHHWSSEPYLITIGNYCQLTNCKIFTHGGGGNVFVICILCLIVLARLLLAIMYILAAMH